MKMKKIGLWLAAILAVSFHVQAAVTTRITAFDGPPKNAPEYAMIMSNAFGLVLTTGTLPTGQRTGPTDARLLQRVGVNNFMTTTDIPFHSGEFNSPAPWNTSRGNVVWEILDVQSDALIDDVSLADIVGVYSSGDSDNILGKTTTFDAVGVGYSSIAIGIRTDGSMITSGPANQKAKRILVGIGSKSFPVASVNDVKAVRDYLNQFVNWNLKMVVTVKGSTSTLTLFMGPPPLIPFKSNGHFWVTSEDTGDSTSYGLQASTSMENPIVWTAAGTFVPGRTNDLGALSNQPMLFVQYSPRIKTQSFRLRYVPAPPVEDFTS